MVRIRGEVGGCVGGCRLEDLVAGVRVRAREALRCGVVWGYVSEMIEGGRRGRGGGGY